MSLWNCCQLAVSLSTGLRVRCSPIGWPCYSYYIWYRGQFKTAIWKGRQKGRGRLRYRKKERVTERAISITLSQSRPVLKKERWDGRSRLRNARKCLHSSLMSHSEPPVWHRESILDEMKWQETHEIQTFLWCIVEFAWPFDGVNCCSSVKAYRSCVYFLKRCLCWKRSATACWWEPKMSKAASFLSMEQLTGFKGPDFKMSIFIDDKSRMFSGHEHALSLQWYVLTHIHTCLQVHTHTHTLRPNSLTSKGTQR